MLLAGWLVGWLGRFTGLLYFLRCNCRCKRAHRPSVLYASGFRYVPLVRMTPPVLKQYRMTRDACSRSKIWFICKLPPPGNFEPTVVFFICKRSRIVDKNTRKCAILLFSPRCETSCCTSERKYIRFLYASRLYVFPKETTGTNSFFVHCTFSLDCFVF